MKQSGSNINTRAHNLARPKMIRVVINLRISLINDYFLLECQPWGIPSWYRLYNFYTTYHIPSVNKFQIRDPLPMVGFIRGCIFQNKTHRVNEITSARISWNTLLSVGYWGKLRYTHKIFVNASECSSLALLVTDMFAHLFAYTLRR